MRAYAGAMPWPPFLATLVWLCFGASVGSSGAAQEAPSAQEPEAEQAIDPAMDPRIRVLLLGDSISQGYHWKVVELLGEDYHVVRPMRPNGKAFENCEGTTRGVRELERWLALDGGHWDVIHFNFGLHDLKRVQPDTGKNSTNPDHPRQAELPVYLAQLEQIVDRLEQEGAQLVFATTTPVPEGVRPYRENADAAKYNFAAWELMYARGIPVNDLYSAIVNDLDKYQGPRDVHFRKEGSDYLASVVAKRILELTKHELRFIQAGVDLWQINRAVFVEELVRGLGKFRSSVLQLDEFSLEERRTIYGFDRTRDLLRSSLRPAGTRFDGRWHGEFEEIRGRAKMTRTLQRDGYSIEHLLIESRPGMRIPAHLYLPDPEAFPPPWAGVLVPCGHTYEGKSHPDYQRGGMHLARHGMAALVFDPLDQGERIQAPKDDDSRQQHWGTTSHNIVGGQARLVGWSQAGLEAWDSMRCVDYLVSRDDIDAERLGVCGQSGGGTQTSQVFAIDTRLKAAAPACYITSLPALAQTIGPQDDEQNIFGQVKDGLDHRSYLLARAPAPFLICAAEDDFFSIEGTRETYERVHAIYESLGYGDHAQLVVSPGGHNWGDVLVSATVAFMAKHLDGREIEVTWSNEVPMTQEEARVTPRGHVVWMEGERTVYDLIRERAEEVKEARKARATGEGETLFGTPVAVRETRVHIALRIFDRDPGSGPEPVKETAQHAHAKRTRSAWLYPDGTVALHAAELIAENEEQDPEVATLVIGAGVSTASIPEGAPGSVHFLDVVCSGELTPTDRPWYGSFGPAGTDGAYGVLLGRPLLGRQVEQIIDFASQMPGRERLVASGLPALAAAHAYALAPDEFTVEHGIELPFASWTDLFGYGSYRNALAFVPQNALFLYDLPDLLPKDD